MKHLRADATSDLVARIHEPILKCYLERFATDQIQSPKQPADTKSNSGCGVLTKGVGMRGERTATAATITGAQRM